MFAVVALLNCVIFARAPELTNQSSNSSDNYAQEVLNVKSKIRGEKIGIRESGVVMTIIFHTWPNMFCGQYNVLRRILCNVQLLGEKYAETRIKLAV